MLDRIRLEAAKDGDAGDDLKIARRQFFGGHCAAMIKFGVKISSSIASSPG